MAFLSVFLSVCYAFEETNGKAQGEYQVKKVTSLEAVE
jgi:hypothetical protein